jgi:hypothetical protein
MGIDHQFVTMTGIIHKSIHNVYCIRTNSDGKCMFQIQHPIE